MMQRLSRQFFSNGFYKGQINRFHGHRSCWTKSEVDYVQGQSPEVKIREYFYYIDHQGMLFLDDSRMKNFTSCFKEKKFLQFFFTRIRRNETGKYEADFPWLSLCGRERNFLRCDDLPVVYTHLLSPPSDDDRKLELSFGHAGDLLRYPFDPESICMFEQGRVYHAAEGRYGSVALIKSSLAIEMSNFFSYEGADVNMPSHLTWSGTKFKLNQRLLPILKAMRESSIVK